MSEIRFLSEEDVQMIHQDQIERYGGQDGVLDAGLLQSAIAMPQQTFNGNYLHGDVFEMAAAYLFHLSRDHAFVDGNKRTGAVAAILFLEQNGKEFSVEEDALVEIAISAAEGKADKKELAEFFRKFCADSK